MIDKLLFMDIEATNAGQIMELGLVLGARELKTSSIQEARDFIQIAKPSYLVGHNFVAFDKKLLEQTSINALLQEMIFIDTLLVSMLLFNEKTFHSLPKNYKTEDNFLNDPIKDAQLSRDLLSKCIEKFKTLPLLQCNVLYSLLKEIEGFTGFFELIFTEKSMELLEPSLLLHTIKENFSSIIKHYDKLEEALVLHKVELAFILAIRMPELEVNTQPPKVLYDNPHITQLQEQLCFDYSQSVETLESFAKEVFGFKVFRDFKRQDATLETGWMLSQREIIEAALRKESFLAVLPTGGGKTFTFWLPAIMRAKALKTLTVVISPLQALIKDHIDSFHEKVANFKAVALSGYLSPLERADAIEKVINGEADILYLAPESLRSHTIFNMLKNRVIDRFVIDEAHCLSTWGNDFRHDYFYIGAFIQELLDAKPFQNEIPISCFTATAKPKVVDDIVEYIETSLHVKMNRHIAIPTRTNLDYSGVEVENGKEKYTRLLEIINSQKGATLIYIPSSTKKCDEIANQLAQDTGKHVRSFHAKLESDVKMQILKEFIDDLIDIVVATTAFGMGVDKSNIHNVIHYEISESLENYAQEAGRGARDENLRAFCPLLFDESDLDKHFAVLNSSKINADEVNAVFRIIKQDNRNPVTLTTREIASFAGWDTEDNHNAYDAKVKTALLELEREEYLARSRNKMRFYADAVAKNAFDLLDKEVKKNTIGNEESVRLFRVLHGIVGNGKTETVEVDELSDMLGYSHELIAQDIFKLKEMGIVSDAKDLTLSFSLQNAKNYTQVIKIENMLHAYLLKHYGQTLQMSELNERLLESGIVEGKTQNFIPMIKILLKSWKNREHRFKFHRIDRQKDMWYFEFINAPELKGAINTKQKVASQLIEYFAEVATSHKETEKVTIEFSMLELQKRLGTKDLTLIDRALLHLHELKMIELGRGRFIYYAPMTIEKKEKMLVQNKRYTKTEYKMRLEPYYQRKMESIHIAGEYSSRLVKDTNRAQVFMKDYFTLSYDGFLRKYQELKEKFKRPMTEHRYRKIFKELSPEQQKVIEDKESQAMMILAGPGSGKTKVLVHKIASLILQEDIKADQFLMLTYSRTAMLEFKSRLFGLIGQLAYDVDIFTFHGYALQLVGRKVESKKIKGEKDELLKSIVAQAAQYIADGIVELPFKTVIVLDEYQDINADGFALVKAIANAHENKKRVIAVGDDDQCILKSVNGADVGFIKKFEEVFGVDEEGNKSYAQYELLTNFRSQNAIVGYTNAFAHTISNRYKQHDLQVHSTLSGEVTILQCQSKYLQQPALLQVKEHLYQGDTIAILAHSNDEVADIFALLLDEGIPATYLLDNEGFSLRNLVELVALNAYLEEKTVDENTLWEVYAHIKARFEASKNLSLVYHVIKGFIDEHEMYTRSFWESYLEDISSEQFIRHGKKVVVSTIHKAKGKEFDTVIMIAHSQKLSDEEKRLFYVGMTRAKKHLLIVTDSTFFTIYGKDFSTIVYNNSEYKEPNRKIFMMDLHDLVLGFDGGHDIQGIDLIAGTFAYIAKNEANTDEPYYIMQDDLMIAKLSKSMFQKIKCDEAKGYHIANVQIENVVFWRDSKTEKVRNEPLCRIVLEKYSV